MNTCWPELVYFLYWCKVSSGSLVVLEMQNRFMQCIEPQERTLRNVRYKSHCLGRWVSFRVQSLRELPAPERLLSGHSGRNREVEELFSLFILKVCVCVWNRTKSYWRLLKKKEKKSIFQNCPFRFDFTCEWAPETLFLGYWAHYKVLNWAPIVMFVLCETFRLFPTLETNFP